MTEKGNPVKEEGAGVKAEYDFTSAEEKRERIQQACRAGDLDAIASLALSTDGLLTDDIRQEVCEFSSFFFFQGKPFVGG